GCGSAQLALAVESQQGLVFTTSITNRDQARLAEVESMIGFPLEGATLPFGTTRSILVTAFREARLVLSGGGAEMAGDALPPEAVEAIRATIGPRWFAAAPIVSRRGTLGVMVLERRGEGGFSPEDRDLILAYADRVGADLEAQALSEDVRRLES